MVKANASPGKGPGQHFVPASLLPYGGFGDPAVPSPLWRPSRSVSADKVALSQAQDRFMRAVRTYLRLIDKSDDEFESELGYRRYGLTRKMNGQEAMTMRDLLRVCEEAPQALAALVDVDASQHQVAEPQPKFRKVQRDQPAAAFHQALQDAVDALEEAAVTADEVAQESGTGLGAVFRSLGRVVNDIGSATSRTQRSGKGKTTRKSQS